MGLLSALTLLAVSTMAVAPPSDRDGSDQGIVVVARRAPDARTVRTAIRSIGRQSDTGGGDYQMARWIDPVCPVVPGLSDAEARRLESNVKAVASRVGAPVGGARCQRNIEIVVTSDPRSALIDVQSREPGFLRGSPKAEVAKMIDGTAPIRWGSVTTTYSADGRPIQPDSAVFDPDGSRLHAATQTGLGRMIVVVDRDRTMTMAAETLHDYVALVSLAPLRMDAVPPEPDTILSATTADADGTGGLRPFDIAYLKALYSVGANLHGSAQQSSMSRKIATLLKR